MILRHATEGWLDQENDVQPERIDRHFERLLAALPPERFDGPKPGDRLLHEEQSQRTWINDPTGVWDATDLITDITPIDGGYQVSGKRRLYNTPRTYDIWKVEADTVESGDGQWEGKVRAK